MSTPNETAAKINAAVEAAQRAPESVRDAVVEGLTVECPGCGLVDPGNGDYVTRGHKLDCTGRIPRDWPDYGLLGALLMISDTLDPYVTAGILEHGYEGEIYTAWVQIGDAVAFRDLPAALDALVGCLEGHGG